jgi:hypothetical protein
MSEHGCVRSYLIKYRSGSTEGLDDRSVIYNSFVTATSMAKAIEGWLAENATDQNEDDIIVVVPFSDWREHDTAERAYV